MTNTIAISQIFGPVVQGEGSAAGRHCLFVRTFHCNQECNFCDTGYTWAVTPQKAAKTKSGHQYDKNDPQYGLKEMTPEEILNTLREFWDIDKRPTIIVVSGGEPMMQQARLIPLLRALWDIGNEIHIETAGTIAPLPEFDSYVTQYNVSPKLASSGNLQHKRYRPDVLRRFAQSSRAWFKFVITDTHWKADLSEACSIIESRGINRSRVMMMPEGTTAEKVIATGQLIVDEVLARGYGLTLREHTLLWEGNKDK